MLISGTNMIDHRAGKIIMRIDGTDVINHGTNKIIMIVSAERCTNSDQESKTSIRGSEVIMCTSTTPNRRGRSRGGQSERRRSKSGKGIK
jgi:hypothetical protein